MTTFDGNRLLNEKKEQTSLSERIISATLCVITVLLAALIFVKAFWMRPFQIEGGSMLNTLQNEDWVIADRFAKPAPFVTTTVPFSISSEPIVVCIVVSNTKR